MAAPKSRAYISLPKKHIAALGEHYELDHGLFLKELNPYLNEGYLQAYFREWGTVRSCKIIKSQNSGKMVTAYVRFSAEEEADKADWAGPHYIGGSEVQVKRVVSPKLEEDDMETVPARHRPRRPVGLGYILEDAQWLEEDD